MKIINDFEKLFDNYNQYLSLSELNYFADQLSNVGYKIRLKKSNNFVYFVYEKPSLLDFLKRFKYKLLSIINSKNCVLNLLDYQKRIYKI